MTDWDCEAYGPDIAGIGAVCFFSGELHKRVCASQAECHTRMAAKRQRVYATISELAAAGDPVGEDLAEAFGRPGQLLGGEDGSQEGQR